MTYFIENNSSTWWAPSNSSFTTILSMQIVSGEPDLYYPSSPLLQNTQSMVMFTGHMGTWRQKVSGLVSSVGVPLSAPWKPFPADVHSLGTTLIQKALPGSLHGIRQHPSWLLYPVFIQSGFYTVSLLPAVTSSAPSIHQGHERGSSLY